MDLNKQGTELAWDNEFRENIVGKHHDQANEDEGTNVFEDIVSLDETETITYRSSKMGSSPMRRSKGSTSVNNDIFTRLMNDDEGIYEVAATGKALQFLIDLRNNEGKIGAYPAEFVLKKILRQGKVFSRMSPTQKALLVTELQKDSGEMVGM